MRLRFNNLTFVVLAIPIGIICAPLVKSFLPFANQISLFIIELIKTLALPLIFFAILESFIKSEFTWKGLRLLILVCLLNGIAAMAISVSLTAFFRTPPLFVHTEKVVPSTEIISPLEFFTRSPMMLSILLSVSFGIFYLFAKRLWDEKKQNRIAAQVSQLFQWALLLMGWAVKLIPVVVIISVAKIVIQKNYESLNTLLLYLFLCATAMTLQVLLVYQTWIRGVAKIPLKFFWKEVKTPLIYAFSINSSLVTLPLTLKSLKKLNVSDESARLSACLGTNFNNDGILLYEVIAVLFMIQAYGVSLSFSDKILTCIFSIFAAVGVGGIPEAGIISLVLVLGALHLPTDQIPFLLTVDWILARMRSGTNVLGDITVAIAIDALKGEDTREGNF